MNNENKTNINWYPGHMAKTKRQIKENINLIDVVYELIDARIPKTSKIKDINDLLKDKPRILIMTKKDLCDAIITNKWVKYYENLGYHVILVDLKNNKDVNILINETKKIMQNENTKRINKGLKEKDIKVLVLGIPNVGKSTLINALVGKKVTLSANKPGITQNMSWLKTNKGITLLDTPGILWPKLDSQGEALNLACTAAIKTDVLNMVDIASYIIEFLKINYPHKLEEKYKITENSDIISIMDAIAKKIGAYQKDEIDYEKVAYRIYNDLNSGNIKGVTFDQWQ